MVAATLPAATATAPRPAVRYWICNSAFEQWIRIEHAGGTTCGRVVDDGDIAWLYDAPPESIEDVVGECATSAGEWSVDGVEYAGNETYAEMCEAIEAQEAA